MASLLLRNLFFTILQPGTAAVLIPWLLLRGTGTPLVPDNWNALHFIGLLLAIGGLTIMMICIWRFPSEGQGTISPVDPTRKLVTGGLYRYSRNPIYVGVTILLLGEAIYFWSWRLVVYAVLLFIGFHIWVLFHEEPRLRRVFGAEYDEYSARVRRWI